MSCSNIKNFVNKFNHIMTSRCKVKNINYIPYPKYPINTDKLIKDYELTLEKYIHDGQVLKPENYIFKKIEIPFPKKYFNYESS